MFAPGLLDVCIVGVERVIGIKKAELRVIRLFHLAATSKQTNIVCVRRQPKRFDRNKSERKENGDQVIYIHLNLYPSNKERVRTKMKESK